MGDLDPKLSAKKNLSKAVSAGFLKRAAASEIDMINIAGGAWGEEERAKTSGPDSHPFGGATPKCIASRVPRSSKNAGTHLYHCRECGGCTSDANKINCLKNVNCFFILFVALLIWPAI